MENITRFGQRGTNRSILGVLIITAFVVSGFFAPSSALASATVAPASGGTNISIDTTSHLDCVGVACGTYKSLTGPSIGDDGDISVGTHTINLPTGWEFDTDSQITITPFNDIGLESTSITPSQTSFSFVVTSESTAAGFVGFSGIKVRPTGTTPSTGNMTYSGDGIDGVTGSTNFGTLSTVPGTVAKLAFETQPGGAVYGSLLSSQPTVVTRDQFGNDSTSGLLANEIVTMTLSGGGVLQGTVALDIGTSGGNGNGTVTFINLKAKPVGTYTLTASSPSLASDVSGTFDITQKPLIATATVDGKDYDGNTSTTNLNVVLLGVESGDTVTADLSGATATFDDVNVGTQDISVTGVILGGTDAGNYTLDNNDITGTGTINPLGVTITPTTGQTKVYGNVDPIEYTFTNSPALISPDTFTGVLSRVPGEDVGTYAYTLGTLENGLDNYVLILAGETFAITQKPLTVTAVGDDREYDQTTNATVTLSSADEEAGDNLVYAYTSASFLDKTAANNKQVDVEGISISGPKSGNYDLQNTEADTTANITKKPITVTINLDNKTYNGNTNAVYSSTDPRVANGVVVGDTVVVENTGTKTFADKHVGTGKTVTATGLTLSGDDAENYEFDGTGEGTADLNQRPITVTAVTDLRIYDGTAGSLVEPAITTDLGSDPIAPGDTDDFIQTFDSKHFGAGKTLTPDGVVHDGNPTLEGSNYDVTIATVSTGEIIKKSINVTAQSDTKTYDGTTSSDEVPIVEELEDDDTVGIVPIQSYDTADVGTGKTLTPSGLVINDGNGGLNYDITYGNDTTGVIEAKELTVAGAVSVPRIYNGEVDAEVDFLSAALVGVVPGEELLVSLDSAGYSATYDNKNVATGKTVTVSGLELDGAGASNYSLTQPVLNDGVITVRTLVVTADGTTKVYDSTLDATGIVELSDDRIGEDDLTLTHTAAFEDKNVGTSKPVNVTGIAITDGADAVNYILGNDTTGTTADITPAPLAATINAGDKIYDGNTSALITGYTPVDVLEGDDVVLSGGTATFDNENVGENKLVSAVDIISTGADAGNYAYDGTATGNADIDPLGITGSFTAGNKVYDGDVGATILDRFLDGVLLQDEENVELIDGTAEFADPNVADDIEVTASGMTLDGLVAGNYELSGVFVTTANITKAPLTITADDQGREYGDENLELTAEYDGFVEGEDESVLNTPVTLNTTADETSNVGDYVITASGAEDNNYEITHVNGTLTINPAPININPDEDQGKIYGDEDGTITYTASGFKNDEDESVFTGVLGRESGEDADDYEITIGTLDVGDNYFVVNSFFDVFYTIEPRGLTVTAVTDTKTYDGNATSVGTPIISGELQFADEAAFFQTFDDSDVGLRVLTAEGVVNDGNDGDNYSYTFVDDLTGEIEALEIVITPDAGQTKVYGDEDPEEFDYNFTPELIGDDEFDGSLSREEGDDVGTYAYNLGSLEVSDNYLLTLVPGIFEITKATPVIEWETPEDITYGTALGEDQLNAEADGVVGTFVYTPEAGTVLSAGDEQELSVTFTPTDTLNYNTVEATVLIDVDPAVLDIEADDKTKEYGDEDPALTFTVEGLVNGDVEGDVITGALEREEGELAGEYDIEQGTLSASSNYTIDFSGSTFTIEDTVVPTLVSHTPSVNAVNVAVANNITITFSESVVVEEGDITLSPATGFTVSGSGTSVITLTPTSAWEDNTPYTVTVTSGVADVNGLSLEDEYSWSFTTATSYSVELNADDGGWNLVSLPVVPTNKSIGEVLDGIEANIEAVWAYDPTDPNAVNGWLVYVPGNPEGTNNLDVLTAGYGYWMSVTEDTTINGSGSLLVAGPTAPPSRNLGSGWNLIGYYQIPGESESTPEVAFTSLGGSYTGLWGFDNEGGVFTSVGTIVPGDAFWISLPSAKTYTPSNI